MAESPEAVVRALFDRLEEGGVESALERIDRGALLVVPPEASAEPDTYRGHDGARRYFAGFEGVLDEVRFDLLETEEVAPDTVLVSMRMRGRGAATAIPVEQTLFVVLTVRGRRVACITPYAEREAALAALEGASSQ